MSVERYEPVFDDREKNLKGDWVKYEAYQKLETENVTLENRNRFLIARNEKLRSINRNIINTMESLKSELKAYKDKYYVWDIDKGEYVVK